MTPTEIVLLVGSVVLTMLRLADRRKAREHMDVLRESRDRALAGWQRDQRAMFDALDQAKRAEDRLRFFGHEIPEAPPSAYERGA